METATNIKPEVLNQLKSNSKAKARLSYEFNVHAATIVRWIDDANLMLTTAMALRVISEELNINESEILG
jgi:hypothetical protein